MTIGVILILATIVIAVGMVVIAIVFDQHKRKQLSNELNSDNDIVDKESEWLFSNWGYKVYHMIFNNKRPEIVAKRIGINPEKYYKECEIAKIKPNLEQIISGVLLNIAAIVVCTVISIIAKEWIILLVGVAFGLLLVSYPLKKVEGAAEKAKNQIIQELPRFLDMLQTALYISIPIERAIEITAKHLEGTLLATEFKGTVADIQIGAYDWQGALEKIASKYEIDAFSEFVSDLVIAYDKGIPIYETVCRKNQEIKQTNALLLKENANRLNSTILLPIVIFKLIPLILIMCIPIVMQLQGTGIL